MTAPGPHLFWITSRAAGTAAMVLASLAVCAGLLVGGRLTRNGRLKALDVRIGHEALSLATLLAVAVHGLALLGDGFLHPGLADIAVPFVGRYRPLWTGVGIIAGWSLAALGLSYYARKYIGTARWRAIHRFTVLAWAAAVAHSLLAGTDGSQTWFLVLTAVVVVPAAVLFLARWIGPPRARTARDRAAPARVHSAPYP
jgi:methionine sulfoxide reductase heme-binding subunit